MLCGLYSEASKADEKRVNSACGMSGRPLRNVMRPCYFGVGQELI
jgi:hypothetical protein